MPSTLSPLGRGVRLVFLLAALALPLAGRAQAPDWLTQAAATKPVSAKIDDDAVVLLDESLLQVLPDGRFLTRTRRAVRILSAEGRKHAVAVVRYETDSDKLRSLQGWMIAPAGKSRTFPKSRIVDAATDAGALELYRASRMSILNARDEAEPGAVFGSESVVEERTVFTQRVQTLQEQLPVECARFAVELPPGWGIAARTLNGEALVPVVRGASHTWEARGLRAPVHEPRGLELSSLTMRLAVDLQPPAGGVRGVPFACFDSWGAIVRYLLPKYDAAAAPDAAMRSGAATMAAACPDAWQRTAALGRFAQGVNYVSISLQANAAGGYIPRPAAKVFACNYGDCKDKATLLRGLLQAQGIESFPVLLYAGDPSFVTSEWASPYQFNHCILAIRVDASAPATATIDHPTLGRLLFFDPTDSLTPPGLLARDDLGGLALILAPGEETLTRLPSVAAAQNRFTRTVRARLEAGGALSGTVEETSFGHSSVSERRYLRERTPTDYRTFTESWLGNTLPAARISRLESKDEFERAEFRLSVDFATRTYGKPMRNVLLVFKPVLLTRRDSLALKKETRTQPVVLEARVFEEQTEIELPEGFRVDEKIEPVALTGAFGSYSARATVEAGKLLFTRRLELANAIVPAKDYEAVRGFFEKILQTEQTPVVLEKL